MQKYHLLTEHLNFNLENFIVNHINDDKWKLTLKIKSNLSNTLNANLLVETVSNYKKALHKVPTLASKYCWLPTKSYEQASSELTAFYKSKFENGNCILDLCGGLGVDDIAFAKQFEKVISLDADEELNEIVKWNFKKLNIKNIERISIFAETYIKTNNVVFDMVYMDADRRPGGNLKSFKLEDCTPNIIQILPTVKQFTDKLLIKLSPLVDIDYCKTVLQNIIEIHIVAVKNEVKEILLFLNFNSMVEPKIKAINIINKDFIQQFEYIKINNSEIANWVEPLYFFEPNASIIKANLSANYAESLGLKMLAENSHFFVGKSMSNNFMGRTFRIIHTCIFSKSYLTNYLKENKINKANISRRNFPINEAEIAKQFNIKDGGEEYLFFTQNSIGEKLFFHCRKPVSL